MYGGLTFEGVEEGMGGAGAAGVFDAGATAGLEE